MNKTAHIIDTDGEVIILLRCPAYPFAPMNESMPESHTDDVVLPPTGDSGIIELAEPTTGSTAVDTQLEITQGGASPEVLGEEDQCVEDNRSAGQASEDDNQIDGHYVRIQVSAKHLILSSPVFKRTLTGGWKEGFVLVEKGSVDITISGWDLEAFLILMNIFHCRPHDLPEVVSPDLLAKIGILADYYECQALVRYFADRWVAKLKREFPTTYSRDLILWLWVSWVFRLSTKFKNLTSIAISQSDGLVSTLGLPLPGKIIDEINSRRQSAILAIISSLNERRDIYLDENRGCSFKCSSFKLGTLIKHMHRNALLSPQPKPPFLGLSYHKLKKAVGSFQPPQYCCYDWRDLNGSQNPGCGKNYYNHYTVYNTNPREPDSNDGHDYFSSLVDMPVSAVDGLDLSVFQIPLLSEGRALPLQGRSKVPKPRAR